MNSSKGASIVQYRLFVVSTWLALAGMYLLTGWVRLSRAGEPTRPNVLFVLADDLGWGDPSC